ncbi:YkgJ family cysteine cluster protein [Clostridium chromiireducens]|uniref:YkgJ family cysteine cluster protein n=1 Tax=Clostridium chromiireducens TaxID=225345 RepID=A0A964W531_9CLOT|nr:YkgJ family cysteine cluster protein [Clostridium chromiireducens]
MFKCDKCGVCCKFFGEIKFSKEYEYMEMLNNGDGKCKYLKNNLCSIYENRPELCNSNKLYLNYYKDKMSKEEFDDFMQEQCDSVKKMYVKHYGGI